MEKIQAWLNDFKGFFSSEVTKISNAQAELEKVRAELATAKSTIDSANEYMRKLEATAADNIKSLEARDGELKALNEKLTTAENRATEALAAQGLRGDDMPAGAVDGASAKTVSQQVEALNKKISESTDPKEKYTLNQQIKKLQAASKN